MKNIQMIGTMEWNSKYSKTQLSVRTVKETLSLKGTVGLDKSFLKIID
jgi:hypothetical protein